MSGKYSQNAEAFKGSYVMNWFLKTNIIDWQIHESDNEYFEAHSVDALSVL